MRDDILIWIDVETFGLDATSPILEVGIMVTDLELRVIDYKEVLCWEEEYQARLDGLAADDYVRNMHTESGLWRAAQAHGITRAQADARIAGWMTRNGYNGQPYSGSSVHMDRLWITTQMPETGACFHYRIIDNSTLKETCRRYNPRIFEHAPEKKHGAHRVREDLEDTIEEFGFYLENFLFDGRDFDGVEVK